MDSAYNVSAMRPYAGWSEVLPRLQAWNAHAAYGDTWKLREQIFSQFGFGRS
jgi:hypothetical protein